MWWPLDPFAIWATIGWFVILVVLAVWQLGVFILDLLTPKRKLGTKFDLWFLNRIGA